MTVVKTAHKAVDLAFYSTQLSTGGVGKMRIRLSEEMARRGYRVDLVLGRATGPYLDLLGEAVDVFELGSTNAVSSLPRLAAYLWRRRPRVIVTDRLRLNLAVLRALSLTRVGARAVTSVHVPPSHKLERMDPRRRHREQAKTRRVYAKNTAIITVSEGVRSDVIETFDLSPTLVKTVYNPVVTPGLVTEAAATVSHPFFSPGAPPVIISAGRLTEQKDFPTLLRAFARLRARTPCRLIILGEGRLQASLVGLAASLGVADDVSLPGFTNNPYAYMSRAALFVLSSSWEGLGNVLVEALAVGTPVVATDCRFGPSEILAGGDYGPLVPVGDAVAMADAMQAVLGSPLPSETLRGAAARFSVARSCDGYLAASGLAPSVTPV